jgi:hypothetical protein
MLTQMGAAPDRMRRHHPDISLRHAQFRFVPLASTSQNPTEAQSATQQRVAVLRVDLAIHTLSHLYKRKHPLVYY